MDIHSLTQPIGFNIVHLDRVTSTNAVAREMLARDEAGEGLMLVAEFQTEGRGQQNTEWNSEPGKNLLCSLVLTPSFLSLSDQTFLNMAVCLAVSDLFLGYIRTVRIKWPNDVYINRKKAAGILIENTINGSHIKHSVVGMGINVNQLVFDDPKAASLASETGIVHAREDVLQQLLNSLAKRYAQLQLRQYERIRNDYHERLLGYNELRTFRAGDELFDAVVLGVDDEGRLLLQRMNRIEKYMVKQISMV